MSDNSRNESQQGSSQSKQSNSRSSGRSAADSGGQNSGGGNRRGSGSNKSRSSQGGSSGSSSSGNSSSGGSSGNSSSGNSSSGKSSSGDSSSKSGSGGSRRRRSGSGSGGSKQKPAAASSTPKIGDSRPAPSGGDSGGSNRDSGQSRSNGSRSGGSRNRSGGNSGGGSKGGNDKSRSSNSGGGSSSSNNSGGGNSGGNSSGGGSSDGGDKKRRRRGGRGRGRGGSGGSGGGGGGGNARPIQGGNNIAQVDLDEETLARRRGQTRDGKNIGRYMMAVRVQDQARHIAILEGRNLIEYYVSRPTDDATQIHGNIYLGRVQNVLPGMEAAFIDIGTPKNAVLYQGDIQYDAKEFGKRPPRIEQVLKPKRMILCQVTKNPIAHKGARLTQEVSLPGRFVVLVPNSTTYGISKRLPDKERKRLRNILDAVKPKEHGVIVRTAAENVTEEELQRDVSRLLNQWERIKEMADQGGGGARLLYREPDLAVRLIREEFTKEYRSVLIDDRTLFEEVHGYVSSITPALQDRIELYDTQKEKLSLWERHHVHEQLHKALDKKVWLPGGGSLIIEHTEALTVIDVNTGKNVGKSNLEDTVFRNNLEAATEVARQLRLRDIGGIIVIDFVDMENRKNRAKVTELFRQELARDKTRTQVYEISDLGLVEMTRKRIGEGLLESMSQKCEICEGSGAHLDDDLMTDL